MMRTSLRTVIFSLCVAVAFNVSTAGQGRAADAERVAVVDVLEVINQSTAFQKLHDDFSTQIMSDKKYFAAKEKELRLEESSFHQQKNKINHHKTPVAEKKKLTEHLVEKTKHHEKKVKDLQNLVNKRKENLDQAFSKARSQLHRQLLDIVKAVALEMNYSLVIQISQVLYQSENRDLTPEVVRRLNKDLSLVKVEIEPIEKLVKSIAEGHS